MNGSFAFLSKPRMHDRGPSAERDSPLSFGASRDIVRASCAQSMPPLQSLILEYAVWVCEGIGFDS